MRRARDEARKSGPTSHYPFRITGQGVRIDGEVNRATEQPKGNRQVRSPQGSGTRWARLKSSVRDPKPVDLGVDRLKPRETWVEDRTRVEVQITGMICV